MAAIKQEPNNKQLRDSLKQVEDIIAENKEKQKIHYKKVCMYALERDRG